MLVHFVGDDEGILPSGEIIQAVEMETIPRVGETVTLLPTDELQEFTVTHVDYEIKDKKLRLVNIWLR